MEYSDPEKSRLLGMDCFLVFSNKRISTLTSLTLAKHAEQEKCLDFSFMIKKSGFLGVLLFFPGHPESTHFVPGLLTESLRDFSPEKEDSDIYCQSDVVRTGLG